MKVMLTRRKFTALAGSMLAASVLTQPGHLWAASNNSDALSRKLVEVEEKLDARLGVVIVDTETGREWAQRADERFPMCSTFKLLGCGAVLARVDAGHEDLNRRIRFESSDVVTYSPVTEHRVGGEGMTLAELCEAALTMSDNTAGNIILESIGGPGSVTDFARSLGDDVTRLDRWETELNEATPGDPRDTTTPAAMTANLRRLVLGTTLSQTSRDQLIAWMVANKTGDAKLRAGLPDWRIGDKTGGGDYGTMNDIAILWPPGREPVIASIYMTQTEASFDDRNAAIAEIGKAMRDTLIS